MSGHSKWSTIKRKKEKTDSQRAKVFTKVSREISVCVKTSGADPANNAKLRDLIAKAKSLNVPSDNIMRVIKKADGGEKQNFERITYEGYGPNGVAMLVETLTDNRNRTAANMRHYFDKYGGNLGTMGCVSFLFAQQGIIVINALGKSEEQIMEDVILAGAEDFEMQEDIATIATPPENFSKVRENLEQSNYEFYSAEVEWVASTQTVLSTDEDKKMMTHLLNHLEDDDDVQNVWHNLDNEHELLR